jgi:hypothetical protein
MGNLLDKVIGWVFVGIAIASVGMAMQTIMELNAIDWTKVF